MSNSQEHSVPSNSRRSVLKWGGAAGLAAVGSVAAGPTASAAETLIGPFIDIVALRSQHPSWAAAFAAAIQQIVDLPGQYSAGTIWFRPGTYSIGTITIDQQWVSVAGDATLSASTLIFDMADTVESSGYHAQVYGLTFIDNDTETAPVSIALEQSSYVHIHHNVFVNAIRAISINENNDSVTNAGRLTTIRQNEFLSCTYALYGNDAAPADDGDDVSSTGLNRVSSDVHFTDNIVNRVEMAAIQMKYVDGITISGNTFIAGKEVYNVTDGVGTHIIAIDAAMQTLIADNNIFDSPGYSIRLGAAGTNQTYKMRNATITGNIFFRPGTASVGGALQVYARDNPIKSSLTFTGNSVSFYSGSALRMEEGKLQTVELSGNLIQHGGGNGIWNKDTAEAVKAARTSDARRYVAAPGVAINSLSFDSPHNRAGELDQLPYTTTVQAPAIDGFTNQSVLIARTFGDSTNGVRRAILARLNSRFTAEPGAGIVTVVVRRSTSRPAVYQLSVVPPVDAGTWAPATIVSASVSGTPTGQFDPIFTFEVRSDGAIQVVGHSLTPRTTFGYEISTEHGATLTAISA